MAVHELSRKSGSFLHKASRARKKGHGEKRDASNIHGDLATKVIYVFGIQFITSVRGEEKPVRNEQLKKWNSV